MAVEKVNIEQFLELAQVHPVLDVRSPSEYKHAHIPGAYALPLFTDEERKLVGTTYKQQSREDAIKIGLDFFGPKMRKMVEDVEQLLGNRSLTAAARANELPLNKKLVLVHCWRGGMRSAGVAWLLDLYGFKVCTLTGGYKAYRNYVLGIIEASYDFKILGGYTGSGKTILLKELQKHGEKTIDLEGLASHKGSAFGAIGLPAQPSQEMFENLLCKELISLSNLNNKNSTGTSIWLEDESQRIGLINIPHMFWISMRRAPIYFVDVPFEERLQYVVKCYGNLEREKMINAIIRIKKRLGGLETKLAINFLLEENVPDCFRILLKYYDKYYLKGLNNRENPNQLLRTIICDGVDAVSNAQKVLLNREVVGNINAVNHE